ncbi:MAG TPA: hypothetical protein VGM96_06385 [Reyranella sp.]|jgi:hypothetical protein
MPSRHAIFLNGPIGAGKTVLGRLAAAELGASFIDSDDLGDPSKPWFGQVLSKARTLVGAGMAALRERPVVLVAMPLRDRDWAFFKARFEAEGVIVHCITLAANAEAILGPGRDREFSAHEQARIEEMIAQGYARRSFSDVIVETAHASLAATAEAVVAACQDLMAGKPRD